MANGGTVNLLERLRIIRADATAYFEHVIPELSHVKYDFMSEVFWQELTEDSKDEANKIIHTLVDFSGQLGPAIRRTPLLSEADARQASDAIKGMRAALRFREYKSWGPEILHDEGTVLGVRPSGQDDTYPLQPLAASATFIRCADQLEAVVELVSVGEGEAQITVAGTKVRQATGYRPGTAFIMMWLDKEHPELVDISDTVKRCFSAFGIEAIRADDIQHEDVITKQILDEIKSAEFLFADLTGERPSVYYEVGYAHAIGRRVMLFRKTKTSIHFDLAAYNCPEYENLRELEELLTKRLRSITGQNPTT